MQEQETGTIDISALDLPPQELAAFEAAVAQGELGDLVPPWQPWWMTQDAAELRLNERGQRMVQGASFALSCVILQSGVCHPLTAIPAGYPCAVAAWTRTSSLRIMAS